jgi:hypothetical protein
MNRLTHVLDHTRTCQPTQTRDRQYLALPRSGVINGPMPRHQGAGDRAHKPADDRPDRGPRWSAAQKSVRLPRRRGNSCSGPGADPGPDESVAQALVPHNFHAADFLLRNRLWVCVLLIRNPAVRNTHKASRVFLRAPFGDLNVLSRSQRV